MSVGSPWLPAFLAEQGLPPAFETTLDAICRPLAAMAQEARRMAARTVVVGLCGPQGSGKSTIAAATARLLEGAGLRTAVLSIDDVYLPRAERLRLAATVHPLFATRGPPGTHNVAQGLAVLDALAASGPTALPRFDKGRDEAAPRADWPVAQGPLDVVLFEGWCLGARPEPATRLARPVNALETDEDPKSVWRRAVNDQLAGAYAELFARLDRLALLTAPDFATVAAWRGEQERKLRQRTGRGMADEALPRFLAHYERLTLWIAQDMPARADRVFRLGRDRRPL